MRRAIVLGALSALSLGLLPGTSAAAAVAPVHHVFVIMEENESESTSFGPGSPAPYLAQTLVSEGAFVPNYYGIGHLEPRQLRRDGQRPGAESEYERRTAARLRTSPRRRR